MLPFGVTIPATVPQGSEIPEGLMNNRVYYNMTEKKLDFNLMLVGTVKDFKSLLYEAAYFKWKVTASLPL
jgi:hypothetical protein